MPFEPIYLTCMYIQVMHVYPPRMYDLYSQARRSKPSTEAGRPWIRHALARKWQNPD